MVDSFVGEIRMFMGSYAPEYFAICNGNALGVSQYQVLFSLIGTTFGGNGTTNFCVPDMRSRVPVGQGQGTNLTNRVLGATGGAEEVGLTGATMPIHTHTMVATTTTADVQSPKNALLGALTGTDAQFAPNTTAANAQLRPMATSVIDSAGNGVPHSNIMPCQPVNFMICTQGTYPVRA
ncbi:hypothetical protein TSH100_08365 [Azospirillum sp. TSH100]|uniref:phage tail protein n=1 Tax=Azospirillum sp. TSH100 TaxID=652764 RepID=UPI000D61BA02|nr:tail fiber protein [Azospirillum sp. TSH100]PWC88092.1 hypothetical protein TSH100_08365 [Azospirillum sp. TSH100]QCG92168.1 phage tail protein [Azospirillum sp. TSH100]